MAAAELFYEQGIHRSTVDDAVARAGFSKPTLYQHFRSKDELIEAGLELRDRRHRERLTRLWEQPGRSAADRLLAPFEVLEGWLDTRPDFRGCAFVNAAVELPSPEHPGRTVVRNHKRWLREYMEECAKEIGSPDPAGLAAALLYLLEGAMVVAYIESDRSAGAMARRGALTLIAAHSTSRPDFS